MQYSKIESLKLTLTNLARQGSKIRIPSFDVSGKIVGIGFKPYWTSPLDSKIETLEIQFTDDYGRLIPFNFYNITNYDIIENDRAQKDDSINTTLDIHIFSPNKNRDEDPYEKIRVEIFN
ncbi:MAG: hypothetical protein GX796_05765 [Clostridiaceae bacterium]|nr:hypothetical protein [Clostridiaceae bacterium]